MSETRARGERSIAVGDKVIHSLLITGDDNRVFSGDYEPLSTAYLRPDSVFRRVRLERFAGRDWLITRVDAFLESHDSGCLILEAAAGLGKTTFLAHLIQERGYIHHFVERNSGQGGVVPGLKNLAAQLILAWRLAPYFTDEVLPLAATRPDFLQSLLFEAARQRDATAPGQKIVLVVDALDESFASPGQNVMGLPKVLPPGVFLLVSQRPVPVPLAVEGPRQVIRLEAAEPENLADMRAYLKAATQIREIARPLEQSGFSEEQFAEILLEKCQGVWIYLHYIVWEIERGERTISDLSSLPDGLWQYYAQYWSRWQSRSDWQTLSLPLLSTLGAAQEDISLDLLCAVAGVSPNTEVRTLLEEHWRPFLVVLTQGERRYRLYHASLREFLDGRADLEGMTSAEQAVAGGLAAAVREAHQRFSRRALDTWGGLQNGLPGLEAGGRTLDAGYAFRHIVTHLRAEDNLEELVRLLTLEWKRPRAYPEIRSSWRGWLDRLLGRSHRETIRMEKVNAWYTAREENGATASYLDDVGRTWEAAEALCEQDLREGRPLSALWIQVLCSLLNSSLAGLAGSLGPRLLAALVEKRIWAPEHALAYGLQVPNPLERAASLCHLAIHLPESAQKKALHTVLALFLSNPLNHSDWKERVVEVFPPGLPEPFLHELLAITLQIPSEHDRIEVLRTLVSKSTLPISAEFMDAIESLGDNGKAIPLAALVEISPAGNRPVLAAQVAEAIRRQKHHSEPGRTRILLSIAEYLPDPERDRILQDARKLFVEHPWPPEQRGDLLMELIARWRGPGFEPLCEAAWTLVLALPHGADRLLQKLIPVLPQEFQERARAALSQAKDPWVQAGLRAGLVVAAARSGQPSQALAEIRAMESSYGRPRAEALAEVAPELPPETYEEAITIARRIFGASARTRALDGLAPQLPEPLLRRALSAALEIGDGWDLLMAQTSLVPELARRGKEREVLDWAEHLSWGRGRAIATMAPYLSPELRYRATEVAQGITSPQDRAEALAGLAVTAPAAERHQRLREALASMWDTHNLVDVVEQICKILPHLEKRDRRSEWDRVWKLLRTMAADPQRGFEVSDCLTLLGPTMTQDDLREALDIASQLQDSGHLRSCMESLASQLPDRLLEDALQNSWYRSPDLRATGFASTQRLPKESSPGLRTRIATKMAALLGDLSLRIRFLRWLGDSEGLAWALAEKAKKTSGIDRESAVHQALSAAQAVRSPVTRAEILAVLVPWAHRGGEILCRGLTASLAIPDPLQRATALERFAPLLHPVFRERLLQEIRALRREVEPTPTLQEAVAGLAASGNPGDILEIAQHLTGPDKDQALADALDALQQIDLREMRLRALAQIIPHLSREAAEKALQEILPKAIFNSYQGKLYAQAVSAISPGPSEGFWKNLLESLNAEPVYPIQAVLSELLPLFPADFVPDLLPIVERLPDGDLRGKALRTLVLLLNKLPEPEKSQAAYTLVRTTLRRSTASTRAVLVDDLAALAPVIAHLGGLEALETTFRAIDATERWWP